MTNPHMWIPNHSLEPFDEVCALCGVFSGAHKGQGEPAAASRPCPGQWPDSTMTNEDLAHLEAQAEAEDRAAGKGALYDDRCK
jgi:hypothetical protein